MTDERRCSECGAAAPTAARFCGQCGARLDQPGEASPIARPNLDAVFAHLRSGEQRPATILMTDVSGYSSLGEDADPEWLYDLINEVFGELVECLVGHGAHIDNFVGDEIVALFGVPVAQERSVERAVRAALALRERMAELNREGRFGAPPLGLHTGINVGRVMVGPVGPRAHADYTVIGDAVSLTKRLEDAAPEGEIYVSAGVREAVADLFEFEYVSREVLPGRRHETEVFRVVDARRVGAGRPEQETPLLGRDRELAAVSGAAERALGGRQTVLYVTGPPGIGKSRLLREWSRSGASEGFRLVECACHASGHHFPLLPIVEVTTQLTGLRLEGWPPRVIGDSAAALSALAVPDETKATVRGLLDAFGSPPERGDEGWRQVVGSALREVVAAATSAGPLGLILEDIQWLDEASSNALAEALPTGTDWPVVVFLTSREPLEQRIPAGLEPDRLALSALSSETIQQLTRAWALPDLLPQSTVETIARRAEGHPYFARELVGALRHEGLHVIGGAELPHTLQELFLAELDWLPSGLRRLVQAASVLGEPLTVGLLEAAMGTETRLEPELMVQATDGGLLRVAAAPEQFTFGRRLLFEAAYATIPTARKRELHARIATRITEGQDTLGELALHAAAHHAYLGFGDERAVDLLLASARRYAEEYSNRQAVRDATRAMELISSQPEPSVFVSQRLQALWTSAQSYEVLGDLDRAETVLTEAELLLEEAPDRLMVAQIMLASATLSLMRGESTEAERRFGRAEAAWQELGDATRVAHALLGQGMCAVALGDNARGLSLYQQAAATPDVAMWARAAALNNAGIVLLGEGRYAAAEPFLGDGLAANEAEGDRRGVAYSHASLGELHYRLARLDQAAAVLDAAVAGARQIEDPQCLAMAGLLRARVLLALGETEVGRQAFTEAEPRPGLDPDLDALAALVKTELLSAERASEAPLPPSITEPANTIVCRNTLVERTCLAAEALLRAGRDAEASAVLDQLGPRLSSVPDHHVRRFGAWLAALVAREPQALAECPPDPDGEWTIFDLRAERLLRDVGR